MEGDAPIFTGPFAVKSFQPGASIEMTPNAHYAGAEARPDVTLRRIADGPVSGACFASGEVDMAFNLPVETLPMLETTGGKVVSFPVAYQYMMWMNTRTPALSDARVRRAIDLAVSREDLVTAAQAGMPATGAFANSYPFAAEGSLSHDLEREPHFWMRQDGLLERTACARATASSWNWCSTPIRSAPTSSPSSQ